MSCRGCSATSGCTAGPAVGLAGAPLLGVLFGLGWTPCIGPTLGAVLGLASTRAPPRAAACSPSAYCLGLGLPFVLTALAFRRAMGAFGWVKRHYLAVMRDRRRHARRVGVLLVTGAWDDMVVELQVWVNGFVAGGLT